MGMSSRGALKGSTAAKLTMELGASASNSGKCRETTLPLRSVWCVRSRAATFRFASLSGPRVRCAYRASVAAKRAENGFSGSSRSGSRLGDPVSERKSRSLSTGLRAGAKSGGCLVAQIW